jgi:hypothetical protein
MRYLPAFAGAKDVAISPSVVTTAEAVSSGK